MSRPARSHSSVSPRKPSDAPRATRVATTLIESTVDAARQVLRLDRPADRVLSDYFRTNRKLGQSDRAFVAETIYAVLRHKRSLEQATGPSPRHLVLAALVRHRGWSLRELSAAVGPADIEWLESFKAQGGASGEGPIAVALDLPDWIAERLVAALGEPSAIRLGRALLEPAPLDVRVNVHRTSRADVLVELAKSGLQAEPTPFAPAGIRLAGKPALNHHPSFVAGLIEVQDEGSQLLCHLVQPRRGEMVVDFCAGAGGKTLALAAMMRSSGRVYAFDVSEQRLARLKPRLSRSQLSNVHPQRIASEREPRVHRLAGKIDRVLVDAPCSGLGTLRRNPDLKWRQRPEDVVELVQKQTSILRAAASLVKPGGRLVYATCSLLAEENEGVVRVFLDAHAEYSLQSAIDVLHHQGIDLPSLPGAASDPFLRLWPHIHRTDGFFAAVMDRARPSAGSADVPSKPSR